VGRIYESNQPVVNTERACLQDPGTCRKLCKKPLPRTFPAVETPESFRELAMTRMPWQSLGSADHPKGLYYWKRLVAGATVSPDPGGRMSSCVVRRDVYVFVYVLMMTGSAGGWRATAVLDHGKEEVTHKSFERPKMVSHVPITRTARVR
jgi:hypothetical protein